MSRVHFICHITAALLCVASLARTAHAEKFDIPSGDLKSALDVYARQSGIAVLFSSQTVKGIQTKGVKGDLPATDALTRLLAGTGLATYHDPDGSVGISRRTSSKDATDLGDRMAATPATVVSGVALETVTVTSSKIGGDVQNIPISITALSQEQLTATQTAGGPDLIKQVPNMTFTKTNFSGYSIQLRGIGTQAISVTTDPAVAVAFNDIPFIRNHFFEQEFYDVSQVQVLRGPQGTLYGRNATAGVVNLSSAKPSDQFEAMASLEIGNYGERRPEGMINIPLVDDRLDIRIAGEWTKRQGYSFNEITGDRIDGRDLWSGRLTIGWKPLRDLQTYLIWEHFSEDDDRLRSSKQLCKTAPIPATIDGVTTPLPGYSDMALSDLGGYLSQGCLMAGLYSPEAYEVPNGYSLQYIAAGEYAAGLTNIDPYSSTTQSRNLRVIQSTLNPRYQAKNDVVEFNADYAVTPTLTLTSQTGFNHDFLWSTEDYNRFNTAPGIFNGDAGYCDPQLGCSNRVVAQDLSDEHAWQASQEFRLASNFSGPLNFSFGGNYLHYETEENYYVFINVLSLFSAAGSNQGYGCGYGSLGGSCNYAPPNGALSGGSGAQDDHVCLSSRGGYQYHNPILGAGVPTDNDCIYIDPNPLTSLNNEGHNYFLSQNPYVLNSYAGFGEAYYNVLSDLKLTAGVRWTDDQKHFTDIPSELVAQGFGYFATGVVNQQWDQFTGRTVANWTPKLDFTDQTLVYASYSHGYKAGGANPPGAILIVFGGSGVTSPIHPLTFKPEFVDAFELGSKNTLLDGALTLNGDVFYYNYENYQISEIVDRTSINLNFDAHVKGAELESTWEPLPGLRFNFAGGWEDTALAKGDSSVDLIDRTAGRPGWMVIKPFIGQASNCIMPDYVVAASFLNATYFAQQGSVGAITQLCHAAYFFHEDPVVDAPYMLDPTQRPDGYGNLLPIVGTYAGYDPLSVDPAAPANVNNGLGLPGNNGEGFSKDLSGKELPNAPPFTVSFGAQYTLPITTDWAGTARMDYYWQDSSWARVFNDNPYDRLRGYTNINLTLIFTNQNGWQVMLFDKNVFNETAITGDFLNSDDSGLTTNVFLTDPKLIGIRVTKNW
jgi:iron complex outermembrane receptor protein